MIRTVLIYSGGLDSTVALWMLRAAGHEVRALSFDYGQRHRRELEHARSICAAHGIEHASIDLSSLRPLIARGSQTGDAPVPEGHYEEESMKTTVVPNRNMVMLACAAAHALAVGAEEVAYAAHAGDHAIYPDCRPGFIAALNAALALADWSSVRVVAPCLTLTKSEIVAAGHRLGAPLGDTWSCYVGGAVHCGRCGTCVERREAFERAGVPDPTEYE
jgi:7-cyano-7-deazaguanine synthase